MWTQFMDMHSGGEQKLAWAYIYIEAPRDEAELVFQNRFSRNPNRVTCTCCGPDYSISEEETLQRLTAFERNCAWTEDGNGYEERQNERRSYAGPYMTVDEYVEKSGALFVRADEIKPEERKGSLRSEGYVWAE